MVVDWNAPSANDTPILKYQIVFKKADGTTFIEDTANCSGTNGTIKTETKCSVVMSQVMTLTGLQRGKLIVAKVRAENINGFSTYSQENTTGAITQTVPAIPAPVFNKAASTNN